MSERLKFQVAPVARSFFAPEGTRVCVVRVDVCSRVMTGLEQETR